MEKEDIIYKRCVTCWSVYPAEVFKKGKDKRGLIRIPIKKCLYCGEKKKFDNLRTTD